ncbi:collagen-binding domain-containing protein, partial [Anaerosporobacter sp.]
MDNISISATAMDSAGLPYDDINWDDIEGQPFGTASRFNVIVFNDANNIIDIEGPVAIGGNFYSPRGLSVGYGRDNREIGFSPDLVRFLVGGNVSMTGPLVVIGHVVVGGGFRAAKGSTYLIGKDNTTDGMQELKFLYQNSGGSKYWTPTDKGDHYVVPSYDVPRYIPAGRIGANIPRFFSDARESIGYYKNCIENLTPNGRVVDNNYEWILRGNDPVQNVFLIDVRPNGLINKGIRAEVPEGSTVIVRLRTGANAHLQYGVYGERNKANQTLYVFEDASNIYMEKSSDIWGSILAPQAMFHAHPTGGHVSGNAALGAFAVNAASGFEFHYFPFVGGVQCQAVAPAPEVPTPVVPTPEVPQVLPGREEQPAQECPECPVPEACPTCPTPTPCPTPEPCPT